MFNYKSILSLFLLLILYPVWVRGGTKVAIQIPMVCIAVVLLLLVLLYLIRGGSAGDRRSEVGDLRSAIGNHGHSSSRSNMRAFFLDPVLYLGGLFLMLLLVQWWNAGRELVFDWESMRWIYGNPAIAWLPSAIKRSDAAEMLRWFFPAFAVLLALRHILCEQKIVRLIFNVMCISAAFLSFLGGCQWLLANIWHVGLNPTDRYFVTSFGYANHAGIYFVLMLCLSLGLLIEFVLSVDKKRFSKSYCKSRYHRSSHNRSKSSSWRDLTSKQRIIIQSVITLLIFVGVCVAAGRAAMVLSSFVLILAAIYYIWSSRIYCSKEILINRASGGLAILLLFFFFIHGFGQDFLRGEFGDFFPAEPEFGEEYIAESGLQIFVEEGVLGNRNILRSTAAKIWLDHIWFGAGGWSQKYMAATYVEQEDWPKVVGVGKANTHCDFLQFLSEFGVVGAGLMLMIVWVIIRQNLANSRGNLKSPVVLFSVLGLVLVWCYSWIDLPFRSPAVLYGWVVVMAGMGMGRTINAER